MLAEEKMYELKDIFKLIDVDSDGLITKEDLIKNSASGHQITEEVAIKMIEECGKNISGLSFSMFLSMFSGKLNKGKDVTDALMAIAELSHTQENIDKSFFIDLMKKGKCGLSDSEIECFLSDLGGKNMKEINIKNLLTILSLD